MLIDWFTVGAQIANFLILILLLKKFLYGPIVNAMAEREQKIADSFRQLEEQQATAVKLTDELTREKDELARQRDQLLATARQEVESWRQETLSGLKAEIDRLKTNWRQNLEHEQDLFLKKLKVRISRQVFKIAGKVLHDLADASLEDRLTKVFLKKIIADQMNMPKRPSGQAGILEIQSGFPLDAGHLAILQGELLHYFPEQRATHTVNPDLGFGLLLLAGDHKIEWNLSQYLQKAEDEILASLRQETPKNHD